MLIQVGLIGPGNPSDEVSFPGYGKRTLPTPAEGVRAAWTHRGTRKDPAVTIFGWAIYVNGVRVLVGWMAPKILYPGDTYALSVRFGEL